MKQEKRMVELLVKNYDSNANAIKDYNVLRNEDYVKKLKKKCATKAEFAEKLREEFGWRYWSKAQYELIISKTKDGRILLKPWCGAVVRKPTIDVTDDYSQLDWGAFADYHINQWGAPQKNEAKIDVYDQIMFGNRFGDLVNTLWTTRLKYERDNEKFHT